MFFLSYYILITCALALQTLASSDPIINFDSITDEQHQNITSFIQSLKIKGSTCGCFSLEWLFPGMILRPSTDEYSQETTYYWDRRGVLAPSCVFVPAASIDLAIGVVALKLCGAEFAVRGGGHMPVKGAANIDGGILIAMTKFKSLRIASGNYAEYSITAGAGNGWIDVYSALGEHGLYCIGGRLKSIGVAGLTLGGGVSYLSAKYGLAADNVLAYEVVLSSGNVVIATSKTNSDLFWALKGGSNNFGIVTEFTLEAFSVPKVGTGVVGYAAAQIPAYIDAVASQAVYQEDYDLAAGTIPTLDFKPDSGEESATLFTMAVGDTATPPVFANFTAIPSAFAQRSVLSPAAWHNQFDTPYQAQRVMFSMHSVAADAENLRGMWASIKNASMELRHVKGLNISVTFQPITRSMSSVAERNRIGNTIGTDSSKPYIWWVLNEFWEDSADDEIILVWSKKVVEDLHKTNIAKGLASSEIYMGDAADWQDPIASYPEHNIARMKAVRSKYDPELIFKKLVVGGFKLAE